MVIRVRDMYERNETSYINALLNAQSFDQVLNAADFFERIAAYDQKKLKEFEENRQLIEEEEARLQTEKAELDDLKLEAEAEKSKVSGLISQTSNNIAKYAGDISEAEQRALAYEAEIKKKEDNLETLRKKLAEEIAMSQKAANATWRDISDISFEEGDRYLLANLIYCEAGGEPYDGQLAVASVVINREERFGIREIRCDAQNGFCINGKRIILRGACIHHDNGLLGACAYDYAEYRKIRILKENGYNAIRSAHNPCSKAMLRACDELGMLVLDEYVDVWYIHKTKYDYADRVIQNYETDLKAMTDKDYNHPSVVMYSIGNEVSETAQKKGIELCGKMTQKLHELDGTRPVTCGINIFFNFLSSIGFGVYSDKKAEQETKNSKRKKVGSEFFNSLAGILGAGFMKFGATLYPCDLKTRDAFGKLDIAGYNYGINRYRHDLKKYPSRLILGSETFCSDAAKFYQLAQKNPRIIGDFVWAGMDYLGEVGVGAWEYADYAPRFDGGKGWVSAGSGRIDLTGKPLAEMAYTQVAFGLRELAVGVIPVNHTKDKHSPSAWKMSNALESWSYEGYDGETACVEVSTGAAYVEFILNDEIIRKRKVKNRECFQTKIPYRSGTLQIKAYAADGSLIAEQRLQTAGRETQLRMFPEQTTIDTSELCYIRICYTDENGILKPLIRDELRVEVSGGILLGFGNACPYHERSYKGDVTDTYYGEALAIIQPQEMGEITVRATGSYGTAETKIKVRV